MKTSLIIGNKNYSSWSLRAWLLLAESGIEFDEHRIPMDTAGFRKEALRFSPTGRVPVLVMGDEQIWDSLAIAETVAERWPDRQLWPTDPMARAYARCISAEMHAGFAELRESMPMNCRAMGRRVPIDSGLQAEIDRVIDIWARCQADFAGDEGWLFGHFTVADAMYAPVALRFRTYGVTVPASASSYPDRLLESSALQQWLLASESETEVIEGEEKGR